MVRRNVNVQLVGEAALFAHGQDQTLWEATVCFVVVHLPLFLSAVCEHKVLVQFEVGGAVLDREEEVGRHASDHIVARSQVVLERVQKNEVVAVIIEGDGMAVFIVLRSEVDANHCRNSSL